MSVVMGACSLIGKAVVTRLAFAGHRVVAVDSSSPQLFGIEEELKKVGGDVRSVPFQEDEKSTMEMAHNVLNGMNRLVIVPCDNTVKGDIIDTTTIQFNTVFAQRLTLPFRMIKCAVPLLKKSKDASIVIVNSSCAYTPFIDIGLYSCASTALLSLSRTLSIDPSVLPIRVNSVVMSTVQCDGSGGVWESENNGSELSRMIPIGRLGSPSDVASTVQFLLSSKSKYITGESIVVNGGTQLRL